MRPRPPFRRVRSRSGFTLVEVMMATVILVVGFLGTIQAVTIGAEMLATARRQTVASQIITHEIEKLRLKSWDEVVALTNAPPASYPSPTDPDNPLASAVTSAAVTFTLARQVEYLTGDLREVIFIVQWTKGGTATRAVETTGSWLDTLSFSTTSSSSRIYTRRMAAYFGRNGLNLATRQ